MCYFHPFHFFLSLSLVFSLFYQKGKVNQGLNDLFDQAFELENTTPQKAIALYKQAYTEALHANDSLNAGHGL